MKTALISGASQGLGKVIAHKLAQQDYQVILLARSEKLLQEMCSEIKQENGQAEYYVCDISNEKDVLTTVAQIAITHPYIDLLINNAAVYQAHH